MVRGGQGQEGGLGEREVVNVVDQDGREEEVRRALPMMPVRVLLAEGDDSTRHVISALLRKCGYHVSAASDGVKAWELLKEKSFKIDLVLTEVELPLMSGFLLLSTIMEHDACKNIPVIMMSSNDAVSMVFKCMLKGAADFLVKPIRKNELRNLWQHVWRKQLANGEIDVQQIQQEENVAEQHGQKTEMTKAEHSIQNVVRRNRDCSEQESDAQSSCTRSEPEAESKHTNSFLEFKQITERQSSTDPKNTLENRDPENPSDNKRKKASTDIEVVHIIDDEPKPSTPMEVDIVRTNPQGNGDKWFSIPAHQLELSLRRSDYGRSEDQEKNDTRTLNHSTSSAFSLYNCRPISSFGNAGDAQPCSTSATHADLQNKNGDSAAPFQDKADPICHPIRVVALPVPVGGLTFDGQPFWSGAPVAPLLYPQSGPPIWNGRTPVSQEVDTQATSSQQSDPTEMDCQQTESTQRQEVLPSPTANEKHLHVEIPSDSNPQQVSPMAGESGTGSSTVLNNSGNALSGSACGSSSNRIATPTEQCNASDGATENPSMEGSHQLSQREIALNKFRLKRKERCFEKKVRYQSRKLLAEQRPRVKGQFVRQEQNIQAS
ncbi:two-component response regulator-like PRR95 [Aegilops tauschii subsp. strangulata]|uniref:Two-component response regulator-like PRR95 n=2 Tax=Aegilops tauschii subsp. strangulata TaxID=200361 RepID=A0A453LEJ3_AEGTS|nr:two-component response regulator-like PRR95 [Aegilops tauschii subsp. strangulata]